MAKHTYPHDCRFGRRINRRRNAARHLNPHPRESERAALGGATRETAGSVGGPLARLAAHRNTHKLRCNYKPGDHDRWSGRPTDRISEIPESGRERPR